MKENPTFGTTSSPAASHPFQHHDELPEIQHTQQLYRWARVRTFEVGYSLTSLDQEYD